MLINIKCLFSGQHLKQRINVFVSIANIVSHFLPEAISFSNDKCIKDLQVMGTQEVVQGVRKEHIVQWTQLVLTLVATRNIIIGCIPLGWFGSGTVIQDHSNCGESKEPMNPWPEWIRQFLWCTMIQMILDYKSGSESPQRNAPILALILYVLCIVYVWII